MIVPRYIVLSIMARRNHSSGEAGQPRPPFSYEESSCIRATGKSYVCNLRKSTTLSCVRLHPGNQSNTPRAPCTASRTANREANFYRPKINPWRRQSDWWVAPRKKFSDRTQAEFRGSCFFFFLSVCRDGRDRLNLILDNRGMVRAPLSTFI